jgi:SsrA-binding protein
MINFKEISNKRAIFEYQFIERYTAGIVLTGQEVKSICEGRISMTDSFCIFQNGELFVKDVYVNECDDPKRLKKLLLKKTEIKKLQKNLLKGLTIIPIRLFYNERRKIKLEIALSKGKKLYDKKESIKSRDLDLDTKRQQNNFY